MINHAIYGRDVKTMVIAEDLQDPRLCVTFA